MSAEKEDIAPAVVHHEPVTHSGFSLWHKYCAAAFWGWWWFSWWPTVWGITLYVGYFRADPTRTSLSFLGFTVFGLLIIPPTGWLVDKTACAALFPVARFGRKLPFLFVGIPLWALGSWMIFNPPVTPGGRFDDNGKEVLNSTPEQREALPTWLFFSGVVWLLGSAFTVIPNTSAWPEIYPYAAERTTVELISSVNVLVFVIFQLLVLSPMIFAYTEGNVDMPAFNHRAASVSIIQFVATFGVLVFCSWPLSSAKQPVDKDKVAGVTVFSLCCAPC